MSARDALLKHHAKLAGQLEREQAPRRKNEKPEFEVKKAVMGWLRANGFSCHVIESKAVFSVAAGRYMGGQTDAGVSDIFGVAPGGLAVFIELKAPGKRATLRPGQRAFLTDKIRFGSFAVCVDSVDCLREIWEKFLKDRRIAPGIAAATLRLHLPKEPISRRPVPDGSGLLF